MISSLNDNQSPKHITGDTLPSPNSSVDYGDDVDFARTNDSAEARNVAKPPQSAHLLTIALEDYFQVGSFEKLIGREQWYRFESRMEANTLRTLELLARHKTRATFFVPGWNAERWPELVRHVVDAGHEVASSGFYHRNVREMNREEFRIDLRRTRDVLEQAAGQRVIGYRMPSGWLKPDQLWVLDVLAEEGYAYDSSLMPMGREFAAEPWRRLPHRIESLGGTIHEFPPTTLNVCGLSVPVPGGNYFRQFPHTLVQRLVNGWIRTHDDPFVMYFHIWELDETQPAISAASRLTRLRHYRNLGKLNWILDDYLSRHAFGSIRDWLVHRDPETLAAATAHRPQPVIAPVHVSAEPKTDSEILRRISRTPVTVVIPCCNEERVIPYLSRTIESVENRLADRFDVQFLFVDDGSVDATWDVLQAVFDSKLNSRFVRHEENQGVAAAIRTGLVQAETEIVCSMDCDCTYDPHLLAEMIPLLTDDVDLVTASPYHPSGGVRNVPAWRLTLSKGASWLYRRVLRSELHTFTSCFRVYRRSAALSVAVDHDGFLGVAELLGRMVQSGSHVIEYPATLDVRIFGQSKMKTLKTIRGHLGLLWQLDRQNRNACQ